MVQVLSAKIVQKHPHHAAQWEIKLDLQKIKAKNLKILVLHTSVCQKAREMNILNFYNYISTNHLIAHAGM